MSTKQASAVTVPDHIYMELYYQLRKRGDLRNAWRDVWMRCDYTEPWTQASAWRAAEAANPQRPGINRRQRGRRRAD